MKTGNENVKFHIWGGEVFITESSHKAYRVLKGSILVYLMPFSDGKPGRRLFLKEVSEGDMAPGLAVDSKTDGTWRFGFVALDEADFDEVDYEARDESSLDDLRLSFAGAAGLSLSSSAELEEALIELYNMHSVIEEGHIYNIRQDAESTRERSLKMIRDVFEKKGMHNEVTEAPTGLELYDCAAILCAREGIHIAPIEKIRQSMGRRYTINDIARISHFTVRQINLEEDWYRKDQGAFIAVRDEDGHPYAILPSGIGRYRAYDAKSAGFIRVDEDFAEGLSPDAMMFYRPFPEEKITLSKLIAFGFKKVYRPDIVRIVLLAVIGILTGLLIPFFNSQVYDRFIPMGNDNGLVQLGAVILACALGNVSFTVVKNLSTMRAMDSMKYAVQSATMDRLFNLPESFFREYDAADLGLRTMNISQMYEVFSKNAVNSVLTAFFSLLYIFRMYGYSKILTGRAIIMLAVSMIFVICLGQRQIKLERKKLLTDNAANASMYQFINGIEKLRMSASEERALIRYLTDYTESRKINIRKERMTVTVTTFVGAAQIIFSIVFYYLMIRKGMGLSIGSFVGFTTAFGSLSGAMFELSQSFLAVNQAWPMYEMARPVLEALPESTDEAMIPGELTGDIEIDNVTFSYDPSGEPVLSDINLHFSPGEYVGIVGASGCGKSTLLKLLMGFERPQIGKIYYDRQDIDELDKRELRKRFGVVLQNGGLIGGTIYENITITAPNCSKERVEEVVREVGLADDIATMPMGLYTHISEGISTISGGQAQRILIARAIAGKPRIIFFDEATSALDNTTQTKVMETLSSLEATKIVIAHRLSTIAGCDRIIVMDKGRVIEEGNYDELMEKHGRFYELALRQMT